MIPAQTRSAFVARACFSGSCPSDLTIVDVMNQHKVETEQNFASQLEGSRSRLISLFDHYRSEYDTLRRLSNYTGWHPV
jgi:hypothetical protein